MVFQTSYNRKAAKAASLFSIFRFCFRLSAFRFHLFPSLYYYFHYTDLIEIYKIVPELAYPTALRTALNVIILIIILVELIVVCIVFLKISKVNKQFYGMNI